MDQKLEAKGNNNIIRNLYKGLLSALRVNTLIAMATTQPQC